MVREHPFFNELPVNKGMNWEYQRLVVYDGPKHFGLYEMQGEEPCGIFGRISFSPDNDICRGIALWKGENCILFVRFVAEFEFR